MSNNVIRGLCFDLFNTLINVADVPAQVGRFTADILGVERSSWNQACCSPLHEICRPVAHTDTLRTLAQSIDPAIPEQLIQAATHERQRRFDHALINVEPGVLTLLGRLRAHGLRLALISNASSAEIQAWHSSPLAAMFDTVVFSCDCGARKPQAAIYQQALLQLGLNAPQCLFIGDGGSDEHRGACAVGLRSVLLTRHLQDESLQRIRAAQSRYVHAELAQLQDLWGLLAERRD